MIIEEEADVENTNKLLRYRQIPIPTVTFNKFKLNPGVKDVVMVVGGETEVKYFQSFDYFFLMY
jgi:hypothetical protein